MNTKHDDFELIELGEVSEETKGGGTPADDGGGSLKF